MRLSDSSDFPKVACLATPLRIEVRRARYSFCLPNDLCKPRTASFYGVPEPPPCDRRAV
jgi:hypothetical protein